MTLSALHCLALSWLGGMWGYKSLLPCLHGSLLRELSLSEAQAQQHAAACQQELAETMTSLLHVHDLHEQVAVAEVWSLRRSFATLVLIHQINFLQERNADVQKLRILETITGTLCVIPGMQPYRLCC